MMKKTTNQVDLAAIRERLSDAKGQQYWRSLDELANTEEFQKFLHSEFPNGAAADLTNSVSRRTFLKLMGASFALAGLTACGPLQPEERIVPYVVPPPEYTPGVPLFFATTFAFNGTGRGVVVESHEGRPTHIEGNSKHPGSVGTTDVFASASILTMYDPDRSKTVMRSGAESSWENFLNDVPGKIKGSGKGVCILTETVISPTLAEQLNDFLKEYSSAKWYQYDPINRDNVRAGAKLAFDEYVETRYDFTEADVVLSLDADFLSSGYELRYQSDFGKRRKPRKDSSNMNRLYVVEATSSLTGGMADHRLPLRASQIEDFARMVADELDVNVGSVDSISGTWVEELVEDLKDHRGASIVIAGEQQPPEVHAVVHAINEALGNVGKTVFYTDPVEPKPMEQVAGLEELCDDMDDGDVDVLVIIGGNPAYNAPADFGFAEALSNVDTSVHLSLYYDETSSLCTWHLPATHYLEAWSDAYAYDGTVSIVQPLIAPLYGGKSAHELVAALMGEDDISGHDIVRTNWEKSNELRRTDKEWELVLQDGFIENTALKPKKVSLTSDRLSRSSKNGDGGLEIVFRPDPTVWDGSYANNGWLQETPKPITKITWDNAIMISPRTAFDMGLVNESMVQINYNGGSIQGPLWVLPGHADNSITVYLGYGRTQAGQVGSGIGYNAYPIRTSDALWFGSGAEVFSLGTSYYLASTQHHNSVEVPNTHLNERMNERVKELARMGTLHQFEQDPEFAHHIGAHGGHEPEAIFPEFETAEKKPWLSDQTGQEWEGNSWGMVIDLSACTGCNACVVACQSENNIPIVGREEVTRGREMHWIRIDRYYAGGLENPQVVHQPLGCVQCELAPCEVVCPVAATVHSLEGLNDMVYNRCVGTRYCSNNCPYKVRRFNFFEYAATDEETLKMGRNPNVSVRTRGVMEKCSYCVQRINAARIVSKRERVDLEDGDVLTACQAACPTQAITFGDISDPLSHVAQLRNEPHNYSLLGELLTKPRTTYLARVRNPNPKIEPPVEESHDGDESSAEHGA